MGRLEDVRDPDIECSWGPELLLRRGVHRGWLSVHHVEHNLLRRLHVQEELGLLKLIGNIHFQSLILEYSGAQAWESYVSTDFCNDPTPADHEEPVSAEDKAKTNSETLINGPKTPYAADQT